MSQPDNLVSSDLEDLILVNENDESIGTMPKRACHEADGRLHRAFSVFLFNEQGDVLLQKRSEQKMLWPMYWSNACCSHPRDGETSEEAAHRRLQQELGIKAELTFLYKFQYHARYEDVGSEHELCWVWIGRAEAEDVDPNIHEIAEWRFFSKEELNQELDFNPEAYTPWMKMEWQRIFEDHRETLELL
ncbi:MAG: isopentenyl-diphosphate Delta-isomerase [Pseudomonadales bacterium]|nr:isopentenyl-diphosphate Delta-isomerase [Pseudomonadales bacterium]MBO6701926.1 isopentenyl-diphosphate Delta-isomerase [Pseudomonadales bacterium]MBO7006970.1 isopentenyl-diphosphate Delta-isomerase [Pseudomonadales bacterium]